MNIRWRCAKCDRRPDKMAIEPDGLTWLLSAECHGEAVTIRLTQMENLELLGLDDALGLGRVALDRRTVSFFDPTQDVLGRPRA